MPMKKMEDITNIKRLVKIVNFLREIGAKEEEDFLYLKITVNGYGLQLTKKLFDVSLGMNDDKLYYSLRPGTTFCYAEAIQNLTMYEEADLERNIFSPEFWDGVNVVVDHIGKKLFSWTVNLDVAYDAFVMVRKRHMRKPSRETLLLQRVLHNFIESENSRLRIIRKKKNKINRKAYEELVNLAHSAPHSLNILKSTKLPLIIKKLSSNYWMVEVQFREQDFTEWSIGSPLFAAAKLLRRIQSLPGFSVYANGELITYVPLT